MCSPFWFDRFVLVPLYLSRFGAVLLLLLLLLLCVLRVHKMTVKGKDKFTLEQAKKPQRESSDMALLFL